MSGAGWELRACEMEVAKGKEKDGYSFLKSSLRVLFVPSPPHAEYNALHMVGLNNVCLLVFLKLKFQSTLL